MSDRATRTTTRRTGACALAFVVLVAIASIEFEPDPAAAGARTVADPQRWSTTDRGVSSELRDASGVVAVDVQLRRDPLGDRAAAGDVARAARLSPRELRRLRMVGDGTELARGVEGRRHRVLRSLSPVARAAAASQWPVARAIERLGGEVTSTSMLGNTIGAQIPAREIPRLAARPDVATVTPAVDLKPLGMETTTAATGASAFWALGFEGGRGPADTNSADYAIWGDKLQEDHPAFAGIRFQRPPGAGIGTPCGSDASIFCDHGTAVGSFAISRGCGPADGCAVIDADDVGVALRPDTVLDADDDAPACGGGMDLALWTLGIDAYGSGDCSSTLIPGADDPAETASLSAGAFEPGEDDSVMTRNTDAYVSLGLTYAIAAGNDGPAQSVNTPCIAYNSICTGAVDTHGTVDQADDTVAPFSSRGPTPAGRKKPDLVAVGVPEAYANRRWNVPGQNAFTSGMEGTSFAAPQVAAAATLLVGSGITDPLATKAVLINSARQPAGGWDPGWGWGELNLNAAIAERTNFATAAAAPGRPRFFRTTVQAPGERATLVWNRRTTGCLGPGCMPGGLTLSNLDLSQLTTTGEQQTVSASAIDNVEQVRTTPGGYPREVIYKVRAASSIDGLAAEPFAITARRQLTPLVTPAPTTTLTSNQPAVPPGDEIVVTATVTNPSSDLAADEATATLQLPAGAQLGAGSAPATQALGTLALNGQRTVEWRVRVDREGPITLSVTSAAAALGEPVTGTTASTAIVVDGTAPVVSFSAPAGTTTATTAALAWGATDAFGPVASFDVERQVDDGPFQSERSGTSETSAHVATPAGHRYRFRVRARDWLGNTSGYLTSDELRVVVPQCSDCRPPTARRNPRLTLSKVRWNGRTLHLSGRLAREAATPPRVTLRHRVAGRRRAVSARASFSHGQWKATLRLPSTAASVRRGTLTVRYVGSRTFKPAVLQRSLIRAQSR